jgi:hypothetical protein
VTPLAVKYRELQHLYHKYLEVKIRLSEKPVDITGQQAHTHFRSANDLRWQPGKADESMANTATTEIKRQIRETRREMKAIGVRVISCFNGGLDPVTYRYNARLFQLKVDLERAQAL